LQCHNYYESVKEICVPDHYTSVSSCTTLYPQKLALISPTSGGRSVGIVRSRTQATEFYPLAPVDDLIPMGSLEVVATELLVE
jgi:hypothetical protein